MSFQPNLLSKSKLSAVMALMIAASSMAASAKDKYEPFAAGAQITETIGASTDPSCQPSDQGYAMQGTINGTGLGTAIGPFTISAVDCLRSSSTDGFTPPFAFSTKSLVLTAVNNADTIVAAYSGTASISPIGLLVLNGTYTLTSGTGAFKNVKGSGTLAGVEDISTSPARGFVSLVGQISF